MTATGPSKKVTIYKEDNWNQMSIHTHGRRYIVSELSSVEGEFTYEFGSKQEMMHWAERRFAPGTWSGEEEERIDILGKFKKA